MKLERSSLQSVQDDAQTRCTEDQHRSFAFRLKNKKLVKATQGEVRTTCSEGQLGLGGQTSWPPAPDTRLPDCAHFFLPGQTSWPMAPEMQLRECTALLVPGQTPGPLSPKSRPRDCAAAVVPNLGIPQQWEGPKGVKIRNAKIVKASPVPKPARSAAIPLDLLLSYRFLGEVAVTSITAQAFSLTPRGDVQDLTQTAKAPQPRRCMRVGRQQPAQAPQQAWKRGRTSGTEELTNRARALLNKLCPEKFEVILAKVLTLGIGDATRLSIVIEVLVRQVWEQPLYGDSFADLVFVLSRVFARCGPEGGPPLDFRRMLLNACQHRFEEIWSRATGPNDCSASADADAWARQKTGILATVRFLGMLHLRELLAFDVVHSIVQRMLNDSEGHPACKAAEVIVESALAMLAAVGHTVDQHPQGVRMVTKALEACEALSPLSACPGRLRFLVQDVREMRGAAWVMKLHRERPAAIDEIKRNGPRVKTLCGCKPGHLSALLETAKGLYPGTCMSLR